MMHRIASRRLGLILEWLCRIALAAVFLLAAVPKLLDPVTFAKDMVNYRVSFPLIGQGYVFLVASFMPAFEMVGAFALLIPRYKRAGSLIVGSLLLLFIVLIAQAVIRGLNIDCGCFGRSAVALTLAEEVGYSKILENAFWLILAAFVFVRSHPQRALPARPLWSGD